MKKKAYIQFVGLLFLLIAKCYAQNVGIGTTTPGAGLELKGSGAGSQQRITDATSNNTLVLQTGTAGNMKVTGYNYTTGTAQPLYLSVDGANTFINPSGGNVGIGTTTPGARLTVQSNLFGIEQTNGSVRLSTYLTQGAGWLGTITNHPLYFYTNNSSSKMTITTAGQVGIGTTAPEPGYLLDVAGNIINKNTSAHFVSLATGGTNSWARYYMRTGIGLSAQSWFIGSSLNFEGNQFYLVDETFGATRLSIQPDGGPIYMAGNLQQNLGDYGLPKAMLYVNGDGAIIRCYNALTNNTSGGCGFTVSKLGSGLYRVSLGFGLSTRFVSVSLQNGASGRPVSISFEIEAPDTVKVQVFHTDEPAGSNGFYFLDGTDRPFMLYIY